MRSLAVVFTLAAFVCLSAANAAQPLKLKKEQCLACHVSAEALTKGKARITVEGKSVNPHQYIPHNEAKPEKMAECTMCHTQHSMPPVKGWKDTSANVEMCFQCHHQFNFEPCKKCHK